MPSTTFTRAPKSHPGRLDLVNNIASLPDSRQGCLLVKVRIECALQALFEEAVDASLKTENKIAMKSFSMLSQLESNLSANLQCLKD